MNTSYTLPSTPPRILRGHGQVRLRDALRISFGSAFSQRSAHISTFIWGLAFGLISASYSPPSQWLLVLAASFAIAASIGYGSMFPWRLRIVSRNRPRFVMLAANGLLALFMGIAVFFVAITSVDFGIAGMAALHINHLQKMIWYSAYGFQFPVIGFYITLSADLGHRERIQRKTIARFEWLAEQARLVALRSQINPHFFFNALNTIAALIPGRPADAERAVELLATALRPVLTRDQPMVATLRSELAVALAYMEIEQLRLGSRCSFLNEVDGDALECLMPSLSLQPLLENAVRYGPSQGTGEYVIQLRGWRQDGQLHLQISNIDVEGSEEATHAGEAIVPVPGHALHNISERLRILAGTGSNLLVRRVGEHSAECLMVVPQDHLAAGFLRSSRMMEP